MRDLRPNKEILQTYVYYDDRAFFVSTIERDYATIAGVVRGEETLVWDIDAETNERGEILYQAGNVSEHFEICKQLTQSGEYEPKR